mgnify:CR=1 FL=1
MPKSTLAEKRDVPTRILEAAKEVLLERGPRSVTSARVADLADVSQTTMFKYFHDGMSEVLAATYEAAWSDINDYLMMRSFENPPTGDSLEDLINEIAALGDLANDPKLRSAAQLAFVYFRRPLLLGADTDSPSQTRFEQRVERLCERYVASSEPGSERDPVGLRQLLVNFAVSWFFLKLFSDGVSELSENDLRAGARNLITGYQRPVAEGSSSKLGSEAGR